MDHLVDDLADLAQAIQEAREERLWRVHLDQNEFVRWASGLVQTGARRDCAGVTNPYDVVVGVS